MDHPTQSTADILYLINEFGGLENLRGKKVAVYEGSYHPVDSNEMAFKTAARIGFQKAVDQAEPA